MTRILAVSIILCMFTHCLVADSDPFVGTWKLSSNKSKFTIGDPSFMFATMQIEPAANGWKSTASAADGQGLASDFTFTCALDGTPCAIVSMSTMRSVSAVDTISLKRVDSHRILATGTWNGKLVYNDERVVSTDGKTLTVTRKGMTPKGKPYESTIILTRSR